MIRKFRITINKFAEQYLSTHKRLTNRLLLVRVLLYPFTVIMNEYIVWRDTSITKANVTVSKGSIEWYLNNQFDPTEQRIYIETNKNLGVVMGDRNEAADDAYFQIMGDRNEPADDAYFAVMTLEGEHPDMGFSKFAVYVPTALIAQADAIAGVMEIYAVTDFTILEF